MSSHLHPHRLLAALLFISCSSMAQVGSINKGPAPGTPFPPSLPAATLPGTVAGVTDAEVRLTVTGDQLPNAGDKVDFYFKIPGIDDEVAVGSGSVLSADEKTVTVKFEQGTGKPQAGHLAHIHSAAPRKASASPRTPTIPSAPPLVPRATTGTATIGNLMVMPWAVSREGNFGIQVSAAAQGFHPGTTQFSGWVKELNGAGVATLDRKQRSPGGGLGFQTTSEDRTLSGFITSRSIGLPTGDYVLKMEVMAANGGTQATQVANFPLHIKSARPDRIEVSPGASAGGRRSTEFRFDITADNKLAGQRGLLQLLFRRADTQAAIPCTDNHFQHNGQLATAVQFKTRPEQLIDGLRMAVPFDLFPDADCVMDITIYDGKNQPVNRITGVLFNPRG